MVVLGPCHPPPHTAIYTDTARESTHHHHHRRHLLKRIAAGRLCRTPSSRHIAGFRERRAVFYPASLDARCCCHWDRWWGARREQSSSQSSSSSVAAAASTSSAEKKSFSLCARRERKWLYETKEASSFLGLYGWIDGWDVLRWMVGIREAQMGTVDRSVLIRMWELFFLFVSMERIHWIWFCLLML